MLVPETIRESFLGASLNVAVGVKNFDDLLLMAEILHQFIGSLSHYL